MNLRPDALGLLKADHRQIKKLFANFKSHCIRNASGKERRAVALQICDALNLHAQVEEELFYPQVRAAISEGALMDEALVEHTVADDLIVQISIMHPLEPLYDARVIVLGEIVNHHIEEEESDMFPAALSAGLDLEELATQMTRRRKEIVEALVRERSSGRFSRNVRGATLRRASDEVCATVEVPRISA
jgi:hypothetical protein